MKTPAFRIARTVPLPGAPLPSALLRGVLLPVLLLGTLLLASCATASNQDPLKFESAPLFGMIYDLDNRACAGISLAVDGTQKATSDIDGRFVLLALKRGAHTLRAAGPGYENVDLSFAFLNRSQVLYVKLVSFDQLLAQAQDALDGRKWQDAHALLERAAAIHGSDTVLAYLRAILQYQRGDAVGAASRLEALVEAGSTIPYVYLFLADLYQYSLAKPDLAARALTRYLEQNDDPDARRRLDALADRAGAGVPGG